MKRAEKERLTRITVDAIQRMDTTHPLIRAHADKIAAKFSPTNAGQFRTLSHVVWWLIANEEYAGAMALLDALCEIDEESYWTFHALASTFATRAWLHSRQKRAAAGRADAKAALRWIHRDPNPKAITKSEVKGAIKRFDAWLDRADREKGTLTALSVLAHGMRVLVMYQQFAKGGDVASRSFDPREFTTRLNLGIKKLRQRLDTWQPRASPR